MESVLFNEGLKRAGFVNLSVRLKVVINSCNIATRLSCSLELDSVLLTLRKTFFSRMTPTILPVWSSFLLTLTFEHQATRVREKQLGQRGILYPPCINEIISSLNVKARFHRYRVTSASSMNLILLSVLSNHEFRLHHAHESRRYVFFTVQRMKKSFAMRKAGVIPVVATIILISGTLVLALSVGAYMFGLLDSNGATITLTSAILHSGTELDNLGGVSYASSYLVISLNNPGSPTTITGLILTSSGFVTTEKWEIANGSFVGFTAGFPSSYNVVAGGAVNPFTYYPFGTLQTMTCGQVYSYSVSFANGHSLSGSLIAQ